MTRMKIIAGLFLSLWTSLGTLKASEEYIKYDYIIVGNGTAGATLARKLSDDHQKKVLVLEAGTHQNNDPEVLAASGPQLISSFNHLLLNPKYAKTYSIPGFAPLQAFTYAEGQGWGGGSKGNFLEAIRGTPAVYNAWATISGNSLWSYNSLLPAMLALENYTPCDTVASPMQRGVGGPISITQTPAVTADPLGLLLAAGTNAGFITDINDPTQKSTTGFFNLGFSPYQLYATPGPTPGTALYRSFSSNSFLPPSVVSPDGKAKDGRLLRIESNAFVSRVLFKEKKAVGVEFVYGNKADKVFKAYGKKIILCAGAINSPAILQRSGIGDPAILEPLGIKVLVNNPNVGANLINQYGPTATVLGTTNATPFLQGMINASGVGAPFNYPSDTTRRIQIVALQASPSVCLVIGFITQPNSRGSIKIVSKNPLVQPDIDLNMYSDGSISINGTDANLAVATYYLIASSVGASNMLFPPASNFNAPPGTPSQDAALFQSAINSNGITISSHILGTTRMGTSIENGVVDGNLNVFGVKNLMVADLSVAPVSPDGNTCFSAYMIALGAAAILGVPTPPAL